MPDLFTPYSNGFLVILTALAILPMALTKQCPPQINVHLLNCSGNELTKVPHLVHIETQILDLSHNHLKIIHEGSFAEYPQLIRLILNYNNIYKITDKALNSMSLTLQQLSLRGNRLSIQAVSDFPVSALTKLRNLQMLDLSENPLGVIFSNWLTPIGGTLRVLQLSGLVGQIELQRNAFFGLGRLEEFDFSNNSPKHLPENAFFGIRPEKLKKLNLKNIPWICDCNLLWLRQWLGELKIANRLTKPAVTGPCSNSGKAGNTSLINLPISYFQCPPKLLAMNSNAPHYFAEQKSSMCVSPSVGDSVTLNCTFVSRPKMLVQWYKNGALLRPELRRFIQNVSKGTTFSAILTIANLRTPEDNGNYTCQTSNNRGSAKGMIYLNMFNSLSDGKFFLDKAEYQEKHDSFVDESSLSENPKILAFSFAVICICVICGTGLLILLLLFHVRKTRVKNRCQNELPVTADAFENSTFFEPIAQSQSEETFKNNSPCSPPPTLNSCCDKRMVCIPTIAQQTTPNAKYSQAYNDPNYTSFIEVEKFVSEKKDRPVVRTFAPLVTFRGEESESNCDDEDEDVSSEESSDGVDKACPVHGAYARKEGANFCPVHSHPALGSVERRLPQSSSLTDTYGRSKLAYSERHWSTLEDRRGGVEI